MLDDGASACITNDKRDFIEPPTRVNRKGQRAQGARQGNLPRHDQMACRRRHWPRSRIDRQGSLLDP